MQHHSSIEFVAPSPSDEGMIQVGVDTLQRRADAIAVALRARVEAGTCVLLAFTPSLASLATVLGCRRARVRHVGVSLTGDHERDCERVAAALANGGPHLVVVAHGGLAAELPLAETAWLSVDELADTGPAARPEPETADGASTPSTLQGLVAADDIVVASWSVESDASLIEAALEAGACVRLLPESLVEREPLAWLQAISEAGATLSAAPLSRYAGCVEAARARGCPPLELSRWRVALVTDLAPELDGLRRFTDCFAPLGFAGEALRLLADPSIARPDWQQRDLSHFAATTGDDCFEIHRHFATWLRRARPGGYELHELRLRHGPQPTVDVLGSAGTHDGLLNLASYNYLGLAHRVEVIEAAQAATRACGLSASGSPMLSGQLEIHDALERELARFKQVEAALLFPSGYATNLGVIAALVGPGDTVVTDTLAHASIIDGIALSRARIQYFRHNSARSLDHVLRHCTGRVLVAVEGVYSLDGDLAPLPEIVEVCRRHGARLLVDEAHSAFVFGANGRGVAEHFGVEQHVDVHIGTLSKTLGGMGGYVAGDATMVDYVRAYARARTFSCALAPPIVGGLRAALAIVEREPELRARLWSNVAVMRAALRERGVDIGASDSQVIPVMINDDVGIFAITRALLQRGIYLNPIHHPAVRKHRSRFRISVAASHEPAALEHAAQTIAEVLAAHGVAERPRSPR